MIVPGGTVVEAAARLAHDEPREPLVVDVAHLRL
jgi:hypothetical protein